MAMRFFGEIKGLQVVGSEGMIFGNVADLEFSGTKLSGMVIAVRNSHVADMGLQKPFWSSAHVVVPSELIKSIAEVVVLSVSVKEFGDRLAEAKPPAEVDLAKDTESVKRSASGFADYVGPCEKKIFQSKRIMTKM